MQTRDTFSRRKVLWCLKLRTRSNNLNVLRNCRSLLNALRTTHDDDDDDDDPTHLLNVPLGIGYENKRSSLDFCEKQTVRDKKIDVFASSWSTKHTIEHPLAPSIHSLSSFDNSLTTANLPFQLSEMTSALWYGPHKGTLSCIRILCALLWSSNLAASKALAAALFLHVLLCEIDEHVLSKN